MLLRSRAEERLKAALVLAPRNPRAVFLSARDGLARSKPGSAEHQRAFEQLQMAVQLFDASSATALDAPGWGHAECYLALGRELQSRGDQLGARNWIEKIADRRARVQGRAAPAGALGKTLGANLVSFGAMKPQGTQLSLFETRSSSDPFAVRVSPRARRLTARVHVGGRVEIVVPVGVNAHAVRDFVHRFTPWIDRKVAAMRCFAAPAEPVPGTIEFGPHGRKIRGGMATRPEAAPGADGGPDPAARAG